MEKRQGLLIWSLASAGLMVVGAFGPWIKALGSGVSGTDGANDGWLVVGAAVVGAGVFALMRERHTAGLWTVLGGLAGAGVTIYDRQTVSSKIDELGEFQGLAQIGWGLNLAMVASISFGVAGLVWFSQMHATPALGAEATPGPPSEPTPADLA